MSGCRVRRAGGRAQGAAAERRISQWNSDQKSTARRRRQQQRRASSGGAPEMQQQQQQQQQQGDGGPDETDGDLLEGQLSAASRRYWVLMLSAPTSHAPTRGPRLWRWPRRCRRGVCDSLLSFCCASVAGGSSGQQRQQTRTEAAVGTGAVRREGESVSRSMHRSGQSQLPPLLGPLYQYLSRINHSVLVIRTHGACGRNLTRPSSTRLRHRRCWICRHLPTPSSSSSSSSPHGSPRTPRRAPPTMRRRRRVAQRTAASLRPHASVAEIMLILGRVSQLWRKHLVGGSDEATPGLIVWHAIETTRTTTTTTTTTRRRTSLVAAKAVALRRLHGAVRGTKRPPRRFHCGSRWKRGLERGATVVRTPDVCMRCGSVVPGMQQPPNRYMTVLTSIPSPPQNAMADRC
eukprot:COSAG01_NODE_3708_length_5771_cov_15.214210_4_plen_404_part_00